MAKIASFGAAHPLNLIHTVDRKIQQYGETGGRLAQAVNDQGVLGQMYKRITDSLNNVLAEYELATEPAFQH
jgi:hypothetical protein